MPIILQFDAVSDCVCSTAHGIVAVDDIEAHVRARAAAQVLAKPEIFDARDVTLDLSREDLQYIANLVRELMGSMPPAPTAVVTNSAFIECLTRAYAAMMEKDHLAFRVFKTLAEAREWVAQQAAK